jgi:parallel beta-helix repeat protein
MDDGIYIASGAHADIINNTIVDNHDNGIALSSSASATIVNCILWGNVDDDLRNCSAVYSCIEDGGAGGGNISLNPRFNDAGSGDFHITANSPCVDAGAATSLAEDFEGDGRPLDGDGDGESGYDMGADEYNPDSSPVQPTRTPSPTASPTPPPSRTPKDDGEDEDQEEPTPVPTPTASPGPFEVEVDVSEDAIDVEVEVGERIERRFNLYVVFKTWLGFFSLSKDGGLVKGIVPRMEGVSRAPAGEYPLFKRAVSQKLRGKEFTVMVGCFDPARRPKSKKDAFCFDEQRFVIQ